MILLKLKAKRKLEENLKKEEKRRKIRIMK